MEPRPGDERLPDRWWTVILLLMIGVFFFVTATLFLGTFRSYVPVTLTSDRSGLVMETGAKVKMRGVQVGRVSEITGGQGPTSLRLEIDPKQIGYIPANVGARINSTTAFGAKFVDLVYPSEPSPKRLTANTVLQSQNVTTEVNTVFENVVNLLKMVDPAKLNSVLTAIADGVRGQGPRMGEATTDLNQVLKALNSRNDTIREDWRSFKNFNDTYAAAAQNIVNILDAGSTVSATFASRQSELDSLLLNTIGFSDTSRQLLEATETPLVRAINTLRPTTALLNKYNPVYTCWFKGAYWTLNEGGAYDVWGGDGRTAVFDAALLFGNDGYQFPDNLPKVTAKGGPGGLPGTATGHRYRLGHRTGLAAEPGDRQPVLGGLLPGHPGESASALRRQVPARPRAGSRYGSGYAAVRRRLVWPRRSAAVARRAAGTWSCGSRCTPTGTDNT